MIGDVRVYYFVIKVLKEYGIFFLSFRVGEKIFYDVEVVFMGEKDKVEFFVKVIVRDENFIDDFFVRLEGRKCF